MASKHAFLLAAGVLLLTTSPLHAQPSPELTMEIYTSNVQALTNSMINASVLDAAVRRNSGRPTAPSGSKSAAARPTTTKTSAGSTAYTSTPALRQQTVQGYVSRLRGSNPAGAQAVNTAFGPGKYDYGTVYRSILDGTGLHDNDAADALAAYMLMGYAIVHNIQDGKAITVPMARGVRAQVAPLLAGTGASRSRLAQLGEEMKLQAVIVQGGWQSAIKEGKLATYQQGISNLFKTQYGLNLSQVKLTDQGLASSK